MQGKLSKGFTLIELMIVVAIIAILAALAVNNYSKYGYRTRRSDGKAKLTQIAAAEERYYTAFNKYTTALADLSLTSGASDKGYYVVTLANGTTGDTQTYKLTATPQSAQSADVCGNLTLDNTGYETPLPSVMPQNSNGDCW